MLNPEIYAKVRLKPKQLDAIIQAFKEHFTPVDHLWVFGSRVNLLARGGDIDLYVETPEDVVLHSINDNFHIPIYDVALKKGTSAVWI